MSAPSQLDYVLQNNWNEKERVHLQEMRDALPTSFLRDKSPERPQLYPFYT
ncbi:hypothetical protein AB9P05_19160 [Roseivirga sp. BDSF3-8]|uniref:hypothetical protein n=1 Tax=Roseivirga sp. BDSF3-8 TaxID=3241598 RepID=UPI0035322BE6